MIGQNACLVISMLCIPMWLFSCRTKDRVNVAPSGADTGKVKLELFNMAGSSSLNLGNQSYVNEHGDTFKVTTFNYYISNIRLNGTSVYTDSNSYHLVKQSDLTTTYFDVKHVPYGTYYSITFMIGVDSLHNLTGTQEGDLSPSNNMFWSWSTGYIMLKFEGSSSRSPHANGAITLHAGGFSGQYSVLKTVTVNFPSGITVTANGENHIHLTADVLALFKSPTVIDFATFNDVQASGPDAKTFADNYAHMFSCTYAGL